MRTNLLMQGLEPTHPGEVLREDVLPSLPLSKTEVAARLGISRQTLHALLAEEASVTHGLALRLARLFNNSPQFWLNLQNAYSLHKEQARLAGELEAIRPVNAAA